MMPLVLLVGGMYLVSQTNSELWQFLLACATCTLVYYSSVED